MKPPRAVVLAAGKGTRMKTKRPKVLHELCGRSMFEHVLAALQQAGLTEILAVVSPELKEPIEGFGVRTIVQEPQNGTGHALQLAMETLPKDEADVLVVSGDMPLVPGTLLSAVLRERQRVGADLAFVSARVSLPTNFGRIVRIDGRILRIVENADATQEEKRINEVNAGIYCFDSETLRRHLAALKPNNAQGELYLTDCVAAIVGSGGLLETVTSENADDVIGVNTRVELASARKRMQKRILEAHMLAGVTIVDPDTTYIDAGVSIGPDTTIAPQTHLRGKTVVGRDCAIGPNSTVQNSEIANGVEITYSVVKDSKVGPGVTIGPFAHLRGGTLVDQGAHIGNFVELKNTHMGAGAKAGHLAYLGDAELGERANIGAGTITCNYDGKRKHKTKIGADAFIGSNSSLIAPVEIGKGALTGAGAVVNRDVKDGERVVGNPARPLPKKEAERSP